MPARDGITKRDNRPRQVPLCMSVLFRPAEMAGHATCAPRRVALPRMAVASAITVCLLIPGSGVAGDFSYESVSKDIYDAARTVDGRKFDESTLLRTFTGFVGAECDQRKVARLIVAPSQDDLMKAVNTELPPIRPSRLSDILAADPSLVCAGSDEIRAAEVLCFDGAATACIRLGRVSRSYQLRGTRDSRELGLGGLHLRLVGFRLYAAPRRVSASNKRTLRDEVWIYASAPSLPSVEAAKVASKDLERRTGLETFLVLRTDPFFFYDRGPRCDIFAPSPPRISPEEFSAKPFITCSPNRSPDPCVLHDSHTHSLADSFRR